MKFIIKMITAFAMIIGLATLTVPAASADTSVTLESVSYSEASDSASVTSEQSAIINGATQLLWWYPNHPVSITNRSIQRAPYIKVKYTSCAKQSASIAKQAKGKPIVVAKPGSIICNTGRNGKIIGGFPWKVKYPAVLKWNAKERLYEHALDMKRTSQVSAGDTIKGNINFRGVILKKVLQCFNNMGGKVHKMYSSVIQVRYASDLQQDISLKAEASVKAKVEASLQCPSGTLYGYAEASASAATTATIRVRSGVKIAAVGAKKIEMLNSVKTEAMNKAEASAKAKITLKCDDTPVYNTPDVTVNPVACVEPGQTRTVDVVVGNPNQVADTARLTYRGQTLEKSVAANGTVTFSFPNQGAGTYNGSVLLVTAGKSKSFTVTVEDCPPPADNPPSIEIKGSPAHLYVNGNAAIFFEAWDPDGDDISVEVSASGSGWVAGLVEVSTRWDGTSCPVGRTCYRATAWAGSTPGTLTITGKVTAKGKEDSASATFPVVADEF